MTENGENSNFADSQTIIKTIAAREASSGRAGKVKGDIFLKENEALDRAANDVLKDTVPIKGRKNDGLSLSANDQNRFDAVHDLREVMSSYAGVEQGEFEKELSGAKTPEAKIEVQKKHEKILNPSNESIRHLTDTIKNEYGEKETFTPIEVMKDVAIIEDIIYDQQLSIALQAKGLTGLDELEPNARQEFVQHVMDNVDKKVQQIGLDYLRGTAVAEVAPSLGQVFIDKAKSQAGPILIEARKRIAEKQYSK